MVREPAPGPVVVEPPLQKQPAPAPPRAVVEISPQEEPAPVAVAAHPARHVWVVGLLLTPLVAVAPELTILALVVLAVAAAVWLRPQIAAYLVLVGTPLTVGIDRGTVLPVLRPSEALIGLVAVPLVLRGVRRSLRGPVRFRLGGLDLGILLVAVTASVIPLLWMVARGEPVTTDDILYAAVLWKYYALFLIIRASVRTPAQVYRCLWLTLGAAAVVATVGILQAVQLFGVTDILATYYSPVGSEVTVDNFRATSTLAHSQAVADFMVVHLAVVAGLLITTRRHHAVLVLAAVLLGMGALASGQASGVVALLVGAGAIAWGAPRIRPALAALPVFALLAGVALQPVLAQRLNYVDAGTGLPSSWIARWENLQTYFWPELFSDFNYILGVQIAARVPAPEFWRDWVFIESGHTWLLWTGGIPLFVAFFVFLWIGMRHTIRVARTRPGPVGVAGLAAFTAVAIVGVLMVFDPHLTLRGIAELTFALLALSTVPVGVPRSAQRGTPVAADHLPGAREPDDVRLEPALTGVAS